MTAVADAVLVVPCYEEAKRLAPDHFVEALDAEARLRFRFVDDGSRDETYDVLRKIAVRRPERVTVQRLERNSGKGEAVRLGMQAACLSGATYVGFWDADLATPLTEVGRFLERLDDDPDLQAVLGSRVKMLGRTVERSPARHLIGRGFATLISTILGMSVYDTQCGAKLFRAGESLSIALADRFDSRWVFDVELLARLRDRYVAEGLCPSMAILEEPLREWRDVTGSKLKTMDGVVALRDILRIRSKYPWT